VHSFVPAAAERCMRVCGSDARTSISCARKTDAPSSKTLKLRTKNTHHQLPCSAHSMFHAPIAYPTTVIGHTITI